MAGNQEQFVKLIKAFRDASSPQAQEIETAPVDDELAKSEEKRYAQSPARDDPAVPATKMFDLRLADLEDYYSQRRRYIPRLFNMMVYWVIVLLALVLLSSLGPPFTNVDSFDGLLWVLGRAVNWFFGFELSDTVLVALVGGTTANVVGLFFVVAKYLYPSNKPPDQRDP